MPLSWKCPHAFGSTVRMRRVVVDCADSIWVCRFVEQKRAIFKRHATWQSKEEIDIPDLRFVRAALAVPRDKSETEGAVILLEEIIKEPFAKYVSNHEAKPMDDLSPEKQHIAEYLCFVQHVQYILTAKQIFISDFQGMSRSPISVDRQVLIKVKWMLMMQVQVVYSLVVRS